MLVGFGVYLHPTKLTLGFLKMKRGFCCVQFGLRATALNPRRRSTDRPQVLNFWGLVIIK